LRVTSHYTSLTELTGHQQRKLSRLLKLPTRAISQQRTHPSHRRSSRCSGLVMPLHPNIPSQTRPTPNSVETKSDSGSAATSTGAHATSAHPTRSTALRRSFVMDAPRSSADGRPLAAGKRHKKHRCVNWYPRGYYVDGKVDSSAARIGDGGTRRGPWVR
ncbi:hypothetical protein HYPSUDRAFT_1096902, partial [Hypholoma sublateritium FD-334 SS-4]